MVTLSSAEYVLKRYYLDAINEQFNGEVSPFYNAITKTSENVFGNKVHMSIARSNLNSVKACSEDETLPSPHANKYYEIVRPLKNIYGTIELSDKVLRASADSSGSLVSVLNSEMEGLISDAKANFARMLYGNENGKLATVKSKVSTYMLEVDDVKPFFMNMTVEIKCGGSTISCYISNINKEAGIISVNAALDDYTFSGGETISLAGMYGKELMGLAAIFDGSSLYGYNKSSIPIFKPYVTSISRSELCEDDLIKVIDEVEEASRGGKINMILCSFKTRRLIAKLFENSKQIVNTTDIQAGFTNIFVNTVPVYADAYCPEGRIYFLNTNDFVLCQLCDWSWLEDESGRVLKQVTGKAAFSATLVKYAELICKRPCGQGLIKLTD